MRFICLVQRAQYHTSRGSFTSLSVTWGLWQSWWYRLWHSWHSTNWFPMVTVICLRQLKTQQQSQHVNGIQVYLSMLKEDEVEWMLIIILKCILTSWGSCIREKLHLVDLLQLSCTCKPRKPGPFPWRSHRHWSHRSHLCLAEGLCSSERWSVKSDSPVSPNEAFSEVPPHPSQPWPVCQLDRKGYIWTMHADISATSNNIVKL